MCKTIFLLLTALCLMAHVQAQNVLNSAGRTITQPGLIVEYSVGEVATSTLSLPNGPVTQGLLQPSLNSPYIVVPTNEAFDDKFTFTCYPNPVEGFLIVATNYPDFEFVQFTDVQGRTVLDRIFTYGPIDCATLPSGTYFARLFSTNKPESKIFKLVKQ
jgi:hypothetical protein